MTRMQRIYADFLFLICLATWDFFLTTADAEVLSKEHKEIYTAYPYLGINKKNLGTRDTGLATFLSVFNRLVSSLILNF